MVKKWRNIEDVIKETEVNQDLWQYEILMKEKPNWNKNQGAKKIFQRKEYSIYRAKDGFIVHNINKNFKNGHTHIRSFYKAKSLVDLCIRKKLPNTPRKWEIESLIRLTNNQTYKNKLLMLLDEID